MNKNKFIIFLSTFFCFIIFSKLVYSDDVVQVPNNQSPIILHDGLLGDGYPYRAMMTDNKLHRYFYGNWESNEAFANLSSMQTKGFRVLTELGMIPKKVIKSWGVKNFNLGKKKSFRSSGNPAVVQLVVIDGSSCFAFDSKFGSSVDSKNRVTTGMSGFVCKFNNEFTIEAAMNFVNCIELIGDRNTVSKIVDISCSKINE